MDVDEAAGEGAGGKKGRGARKKHGNRGTPPRALADAVALKGVAVKEWRAGWGNYARAWRALGADVSASVPPGVTPTRHAEATGLGCNRSAASDMGIQASVQTQSAMRAATRRGAVFNPMHATVGSQRWQMIMRMVRLISHRTRKAPIQT